MQSQVNINNRQLAVIVTLYTVGDSILVLPSIPALYAKEDAWMSGLIGMLIGLLFVYIFATLGKLHPGLNVYEYSRNLLGRWGGWFVTILFCFYFYMMVIAQIREMGDFMTTQIMPQTPIQAIEILFLVTVVVGARLGIESVVRVGELLFPYFFLLFFILAVCLIPEIDMKNVMPVFGFGIQPIIHGSLTTISFPFAEIVCFLALLSSVNRPGKIPRSMLIGALIGGIVLEIVILLTILVLGAPITANQLYPTYSLAKKISIGNFLERIEAVLALMWIVTTFFKTILNFFALMLGISALTGLSEPKLTTLPLGMIVLVSSIIAFPNITYFNDLIANYWPFFDFTVCVALPLLLLGLHLLVNRQSN